MKPAGLENNDIEIYVCENEDVKALCNGNSCLYLQLPELVRQPFQTQLIADKNAVLCLQQMGYNDPDLMEEKFVACRYGALNSEPDLQNNKLTPDMPVCKYITTCPGFGIVCKQPIGENGMLSRREYMVLILVARGKLDKEIAIELNITIPTVRTYLNRIREKLNANNRIEIALWAQKQGIV